MTATAHLLFGYIGAGKTMLAKRLEQELGAVRFSPDEWMARLFGDDPPEATFQDETARVLDLMEPLWTQCLHTGADVALDFGFWRKRERDRVRDIVETLGARTVLHHLSCPDDEARRRIAARNMSAERSLYIAPSTFDGLKARFEPLDPDEPCIEVWPTP